MFETNSVIFKKYYFNIKYFPNSKKKKSYCPNIEHKKQKEKKKRPHYKWKNQK